MTVSADGCYGIYHVELPVKLARFLRDYSNSVGMVNVQGKSLSVSQCLHSMAVDFYEQVTGTAFSDVV